MTNIGIIHPEPGYWKKAQAICKKYGTLLIMDETHTICAGPGGYTRAYDISPDIFVIGKRKLFLKPDFHSRSDQRFNFLNTTK